MDFFKKLWGGLAISGYTVHKEVDAHTLLGFQLRGASRTSKKEASAITTETDAVRLREQADALANLGSQFFCKPLAGVGECGKLSGFIIESVEYSLQDRLRKDKSFPDYEAKYLVYRTLMAYKELDDAGLVCWGITPDTILRTANNWKFIGVSLSLRKEGAALRDRNEACAKRQQSMRTILLHLCACKRDKTKYLSQLAGSGPAEGDLTPEDRALVASIGQSLPDVQTYLKGSKWFKDVLFKLIVKQEQVEHFETQNQETFFEDLFQSLSTLPPQFITEHILPAQIRIARQSPNYRHCGLTLALAIANAVSLTASQFQDRLVGLMNPAKEQNPKVLYAMISGLDSIAAYVELKPVKNLVQQLCKRVSEIDSKPFLLLLLQKILPIVPHLTTITIQKLLVKKAVNLITKAETDKSECQLAAECMLKMLELSHENKLQLKHELVLHPSLQRVAKKLIQSGLNSLVLQLFQLQLRVERMPTFVRKVFPVMVDCIYEAVLDRQTEQQYKFIFDRVGSQLFKFTGAFPISQLPQKQKASNHQIAFGPIQCDVRVRQPIVRKIQSQKQQLSTAPAQQKVESTAESNEKASPQKVISLNWTETKDSAQSIMSLLRKSQPAKQKDAKGIKDATSKLQTDEQKEINDFTDLKPTFSKKKKGKALPKIQNAQSAVEFLTESSQIKIQIQARKLLPQQSTITVQTKQCQQSNSQKTIKPVPTLHSPQAQFMLSIKPKIADIDKKPQDGLSSESFVKGMSKKKKKTAKKTSSSAFFDDEQDKEESKNQLVQQAGKSQKAQVSHTAVVNFISQSDTNQQNFSVHSAALENQERNGSKNKKEDKIQVAVQQNCQDKALQHVVEGQVIVQGQQSFQQLKPQQQPLSVAVTLQALTEQIRCNSQKSQVKVQIVKEQGNRYQSSIHEETQQSSNLMQKVEERLQPQIDKQQQKESSQLLQKTRPKEQNALQFQLPTQSLSVKTLQPQPELSPQVSQVIKIQHAPLQPTLVLQAVYEPEPDKPAVVSRQATMESEQLSQVAAKSMHEEGRPQQGKAKKKKAVKKAEVSAKAKSFLDDD